MSKSAEGRAKEFLRQSAIITPLESDVLRLTGAFLAFAAQEVAPLREEVEQLRVQLAAVARAAQLKRNTIIWNNPAFEGKWVAVPQEDFDRLRDVLAHPAVQRAMEDGDE